jgi:hypothetical protein
VKANSLLEGEARQLALVAWLADYRSVVLVDDKPIHPEPKFVEINSVFKC